MDKLKETLKGMADPNKLQLIEDDGMVWIIEHIEEPNWSWKTVVFPKLDDFIHAIHTLYALKNEDKDNFMKHYKTDIEYAVSLLGSLEKVAIYLWKYSEDTIDKLTDEQMEKLYELREDGIFTDFIYYCYMNNKHFEHINKYLAYEVIENSYGKPGSDLRDESFKDSTIFLDEDSEEQYWCLRDEDLWCCNLEQLLYTLPEDEQAEAFREIQEPVEIDEWDNPNIEKMPMCTKALTLVLQEILDM